MSTTSSVFFSSSTFEVLTIFSFSASSFLTSGEVGESGDEGDWEDEDDGMFTRFGFGLGGGFVFAGLEGVSGVFVVGVAKASDCPRGSLVTDSSFCVVVTGDFFSSLSGFRLPKAGDPVIRLPNLSCSSPKRDLVSFLPSSPFFLLGERGEFSFSPKRDLMSFLASVSFFLEWMGDFSVPKGVFAGEFSFFVSPSFFFECTGDFSFSPSKRALTGELSFLASSSFFLEGTGDFSLSDFLSFSSLKSSSSNKLLPLDFVSCSFSFSSSLSS